MHIQAMSSLEYSAKPDWRKVRSVILVLTLLISCNFLTPSTSTPATSQAVFSPSSNLPFGVVVDNGGGLTFYDRNGGQLFSMPFPLNQFAGPNDVLIAGRFVKGTPGVPVIYHIIDKGEFLKLEDAAGSSTVVVNATGFISMVGAPGLPIFAYSIADYQTMGKSYIYAGTLASHPATPVLTRDPTPDGFVLEPLAVKVANFQPVGGWDSTTPVVIGCDIVFVHP